MKLPDKFMQRMEQMLGNEYTAFLKSYDDNRSLSLRINTLKISPDTFMSLSSFSLTPVPWSSRGYFYNNHDFPGKSPLHEAGLYYIQEPSAMAVGELAPPKPGEWVLDLCAAPGGKTTHLAAWMKQEGFLLANEIHPARSKILSQNIERLGIKNALVTNESPDVLAHRFPLAFDRIYVDAPCSGEGMFRKDEEALNHWSLENVNVCSLRQRSILKAADAMLRPGGVLIYSTCTFAPEEDEAIVQEMINEGYQVVEPLKKEWFDRGNPQWVNGDQSLTNTIRIWPHKVQGEGHFAAVLKKPGEEPRQNDLTTYKSLNLEQKKIFNDFLKSTLKIEPQGSPCVFGDNLYLMPESVDLSGLKIQRAGLHVGTFKKGRFEPAHALALTLLKEQVNMSLDLEVSSDEIRRYLKGETLVSDGPKGWILVMIEGYAIGWGKRTEGVIKNHYPKGLRKQKAI